MNRIHNWINSILLICLYVIVAIALFHSKFTNLSIDWFSNGSIIENAYYIAGVLTLFAVVIAFFSLKISKAEANDRRNREVSDATINTCNYYVDNILPKMDELVDELPEFSFPKEGFDTITKDKIMLTDKYIEELDNSTYEKATNLLNKIEGIALYFTKGYHDKAIANQIISDIFCTHIKILYPFLINAKDKNAYAFDDIVNLYIYFNNHSKDLGQKVLVRSLSQ